MTQTPILCMFLPCVLMELVCAGSRLSTASQNPADSPDGERSSCFEGPRCFPWCGRRDGRRHEGDTHYSEPTTSLGRAEPQQHTQPTSGDERGCAQSPTDLSCLKNLPCPLRRMIEDETRHQVREDVIRRILENNWSWLLPRVKEEVIAQRLGRDPQWIGFDRLAPGSDDERV